ncbi:MAG TPA: BON domain-containing protein [Terriglobales bacterium]|nr:BON domain-containing protein [Terriglobales bacterium]
MKAFTLSVALVLGVALAAAALPAAPAAQSGQLSQRGIERITTEVRHQIVMLPYYGVFDAISYKVSPDGAVTLMGAVRNPTLKSDAGNAVKGVEGVTNVDNQIKVLPLSPNDDRIRRAEFRAIYGSPQLTKYSWEAVQSIHIIVENGHVTLVGSVDSQADKNVAEIQAKTVPGVFSVTNDLQVTGNQ